LTHAQSHRNNRAIITILQYHAIPNKRFSARYDYRASEYRDNIEISVYCQTLVMYLTILTYLTPTLP